MVAEWTMTDAWVFASLGDSGPDKKYTLVQILGNADLINHNCFAEVQFTVSVPRLVAAGLIEADVPADSYWHTKAGQKLYRKRTKRRGMFGWMDTIPPALQRLGPPQDADWSLPDGAFRRASREYRREPRS